MPHFVMALPDQSTNSDVSPRHPLSQSYKASHNKTTSSSSPHREGPGRNTVSSGKHNSEGVAQGAVAAGARGGARDSRASSHGDVITIRRSDSPPLSG